MARFIIITIISLFFVAHFTYAQTLPVNINISINPSEPKPGQRVVASIESFDMDLDTATISWFYNRNLITSGIGRKTTTFTAPNSNTVAELSVTATSSSGSGQSSVIVRSASIDMVWEAIDSYVPPFYKGKALASIGGKLRVVAIPSVTAPKSISYTWRYNDNAVPGQSGSNKNSLNIKTDVLSNTESFFVEAKGGAFTGSGSLQIPLRNPQVLVYQKIDGFIDYSKGSIDNISITKPGVILRAEPFNFSITNSLENSLSFNFLLDDESFSGSNNMQEISITKPENSGQSSFVINVNSIKERLQAITRSFTLNF